MAARKKIRFKKSVKIVFWVVVSILLIALVESAYQGRKVGEIYISINNQEKNHFIDSTEIKRLLTRDNKEKLTNFSYRNISIKKLESRVKANLFVQSCEIARNLQGDLFVDVHLSRPVARFMRANKPDFYVDSLGKVMPATKKYTARVLLVTPVKNKIPDFQKKDKRLLQLINALNQDKFYSAQITQLDINKSGEILMYPQLGKQVIEFGKCTNIQDKLKRLKVFYKKILRLKGWQAYNKLSLKYDQQIICE